MFMHSNKQHDVAYPMFIAKSSYLLDNKTFVLSNVLYYEKM